MKRDIGDVPNSCPISVGEHWRRRKIDNEMFLNAFSYILCSPTFAIDRIIPLSRRKQGFESPRERQGNQTAAKTLMHRALMRRYPGRLSPSVCSSASAIAFPVGAAPRSPPTR
jgi:hypothetical protein